ncbi:ammonia-forming cytochrome c nitrite reductase subunit c552 [Lutibacter sp.]|uniref:ammonia-forming cytochrome c nitrite reductase subunit c552 n=1 Tax=Lutibacter sp. TaxID=1925666 RepID=UPI002736B771|nr:ammonia-forming cytochrome c nitrite reductase subunit c552 [Lutibacter sp.]MDP3312401.1 ammonia-forming cytochrome c nitrite reductase subunit c552 [Lutibacter sp.]
MKNLKLITLLMLIASSFMFVQCTSEPIAGSQGLAGIDGVNGANGTNGLNGADGGNVCLQCHNDSFKVVQPATFAMTPKNGSMLRGTTYCASCHSLEGYKHTLNVNGGNGNFRVAFATIPESTRTGIGCTTCHSGGHESAGAAVSGTDVALRAKKGPIQLTEQWVSGVADFIDLGGNSNMCVQCHQPRDPYRTQITTNADATVNLITSRPGPHYGTQSILFLGGMYMHEIAGTVAYPAKGQSVHKGASCISCHMGKATSDNKSGNHTFKPNLDNCKKCHTQAGVVDYNINGGQTKIKNLMKDLAIQINRVAPKFTIDAEGALVIPSGQTDRNNLKDVVSKAVWNYRVLYYDHTYGLHNPKYANALLANSIAALKLLP